MWYHLKMSKIDKQIEKMRSNLEIGALRILKQLQSGLGLNIGSLEQVMSHSGLKMVRS